MIEEARAFVHKHIPKGYAEFMNWGAINWGIPLEEFPDTYNGQPLCYVGLGAQKNYNLFYLMGAYDGSNGAEAAGGRVQESREAARHGEVLPALQAPR